MSRRRGAVARCAALLSLALQLTVLAWPATGSAAAAASAAVPAASQAEPAPAAASAPAPGKLPSDIPLRRDETTDGAASSPSAWPTLAALLALGAFAFWALRLKRQPGRVPNRHASGAAGAAPLSPLRSWLSRGTAPAVRIVASQRLTARHSVHVVQWQGRDYFLGCGEQGLTVIDSRAASVAEPGAEAPPAGGPQPGQGGV
jgi:hypothetical protein